MLSPYIVASLFIAVLLLRLTVRRLRKRSITHLPGPPPGSWLVGNIPAMLRPINIGDADFAWTKTFGNSIRIKGLFGSDVFFTTDVKAFQHILNTSCYQYPKAPEFRFLLSLFGGEGLAWAEGTQHSRHRKVMDPAFSYSSIREHLPLTRQVTQRTVTKWRDIVAQDGNTSAAIDIVPWMARTTLDVLGATAFDYQFNALDDGAHNDLYQAYKDLFVATFLERSDSTIVFEALCGIVPGRLLSFLLNNFPNQTIARVQDFTTRARRVAKSLVDQQLDSHAKGEECGQDILSLLIRANLATSIEKKLTEDEIMAQLTTLMVAGHETTASTTSWALYELSMKPEFQDEIRQEIKATRVRAAQRGDTELSAADLDSMKCLGAALKETLRYHPILPQMMRVAGHDDIIPLSAPHKSQTGELITSLPISKGQSIVLSIAAFNRLESVWGADADTWRPQRFLEDIENHQKTGLGVFANIATFSSGVRTCIGWRFAMLEMQAMLLDFIENFEFSPAPGNVKIRRAGAGVMTPIVQGSNVYRAELPLTITPVV